MIASVGSWDGPVGPGAYLKLGCAVICRGPLL
jgi:hypothetical protein